MIGIFDSGSGGLTVLREVRKRMPLADIVYFGDLRNVPYGEKRPEVLARLTVAAIERLLECGAHEVVSACNSVSSTVAQPLIHLMGVRDFKMIEMVGPTVASLCNKSAQNKKQSSIGLIATQATVTSGIYKYAFESMGVTIESCAMPGLVELIESEATHDEVLAHIRPGIDELLEKECDTILLGCTQYPLIRSVFASYAPSVTWFDPAQAVAESVQMRFSGRGTGITRCILSKESVYFRNVIAAFFPEHEVSIEVCA